MGRTLLIIQFLFGALIVLFSVTHIFWVNAIILFGCGAGLVMTFAILNSLIQLIVPNEMRGRVVGIYMVAFRGGMPLGGLASGWVATLTSASTVLTINGVLLSLVAAWFLFKSHGVREL
jgi:MFS family permease